VYSEGTALADLLYLTEVHRNFQGDTRLPDICRQRFSTLLVQEGPIAADNTRLSSIKCSFSVLAPGDKLG
jgi:Dihydrofolate reductase